VCSGLSGGAAFFGVVIQMLPGFNKLPVVFWVSLTAVIVSIPSFPGGVWIVRADQAH